MQNEETKRAWRAVPLALSVSCCIPRFIRVSSRGQNVASLTWLQDCLERVLTRNAGNSHRIETATTLSDSTFCFWQALTTLTMDYNRLQSVSVRLHRNHPRRFYRAIHLS